MGPTARAQPLCTGTEWTTTHDAGIIAARNFLVDLEMNFSLLVSRTKRCATLMSAVAALAACGGGDGDAPATEVPEWNRLAGEIVAADQLPPVQAHVMAMVQLAVHDALNTIDPRYETYRHAGSASGASPAAAVATATRDTLVQLLPAAREKVDAAYAAKLATIAPGAARDAGVAAGRAAAAAILSQRSADNLAAAIGKPYVPGAPAPGRYQLTPPLNFAIGAGIGELAPFATTGVAALRSAAPPALGSAAYASDYEEVKALGSASSSTRTEQQTEAARFWFGAAVVEWHAAARQGLAAIAADEWQAARTHALLGMAMFDTVVASLDTKYSFEFWRPITAIRAGDSDGNDATQADPAWEPLCVTPPFPEYNSTHAATGAAAAGVLGRTIGDRHRFSLQSPSLPGVSRSYERFSDAAADEGLSRIYCGIHFRSAMNAGFAQGEAIAGEVSRALPRKSAF